MSKFYKFADNRSKKRSSRKYISKEKRVSWSEFMRARAEAEERKRLHAAELEARGGIPVSAAERVQQAQQVAMREGAGVVETKTPVTIVDKKTGAKTVQTQQTVRRWRTEAARREAEGKPVPAQHQYGLEPKKQAADLRQETVTKLVRPKAEPSKVTVIEATPRQQHPEIPKMSLLGGEQDGKPDFVPGSGSVPSSILWGAISNDKTTKGIPQKSDKPKGVWSKVKTWAVGLATTVPKGFGKVTTTITADGGKKMGGKTPTDWLMGKVPEGKAKTFYEEKIDKPTQKYIKEELIVPREKNLLLDRDVQNMLLFSATAPIPGSVFTKNVVRGLTGWQAYQTAKNPKEITNWLNLALLGGGTVLGFRDSGLGRSISRTSERYVSPEKTGLEFVEGHTKTTTPKGLRGLEGTKQTSVHVTTENIFDRGKETILKGFLEKAKGFRKKHDLIHFYSSVKGYAYLGYAGIKKGMGSAGGKIKFSLTKPKIRALVEDVKVTKTPRDLSTLKEINLWQGMRSGKTMIPAENILGLSTEGQLITPAQFGKFPGTKLTKVGKPQFTYYKESGKTFSNKFLETLFGEKKYHKVELQKVRRSPVKAEEITKLTKGTSKGAKVVDIEKYNIRSSTPKKFITSYDVLKTFPKPAPSITSKTRSSKTKTPSLTKSVSRISTPSTTSATKSMFKKLTSTSKTSPSKPSKPPRRISEIISKPKPSPSISRPSISRPSPSITRPLYESVVSAPVSDMFAPVAPKIFKRFPAAAKKPKRRSKFFRTKKKYMPSVSALIGEVRAPKPKRVLGFEIRPIAKSSGRKKKKKKKEQSLLGGIL